MSNGWKKQAVSPFRGFAGRGGAAGASPFGAKLPGNGNTRAAKQARQGKRSRPRPAPKGVDDLIGTIGGLIPADQTLGRVILPFPPVELSPNWRGHWSAHSSAAREYRRTCWALALAARLRVPDYAADGGPITVRLDFFPPSRAKRDDDNVPASFKAGRDGVADALRCDDARFRTITVLHEEPRSCVVFSLMRPGETHAEGVLV